MSFSEFPGRDTDIHRTDPRLRVMSGFILTMFSAFCNSLPALSILMLSAYLILSMASISLREIAGRLFFLNFFALFTFLSLPFSGGGTLMSNENILFFVKMLLKINSALFFTSGLICTMDASDFGHALTHLRVPGKMIHIFLFSLRFLEIMRAEYMRLKESAAARAFRPGTNLHSMKTAADMAGMIIVKSIDRAEISLDAMKARCFCGNFYKADHFTFKEKDLIAALLLFSLGAAVIFSEYIHQ